MSEKWGSFGAVFYTKNASQLSERHFLRCLAISTSGRDMNDLGAIFLIFNYMW